MGAVLSGTLVAGSAASRAAALAGALAESGITSLEIERSDKLVQLLDARTTDLPGELARAKWNALLRARPHTAISVTPDAIEWTTEHPGVHGALGRAAAWLEKAG